MPARLLIVSNRSPVTVAVDGEVVRVEPSTGGLATGLSGPHERGDGVWVGWPGYTGALDPAHAATVAKRLAELRVVPVSLTADEVRDYYEGVSNGVLWPLFHSLVGLLPLEFPDFAVYRQVNERFADALVAHARPDDTIWVHDYQLMLVPALVRERLPDATIGFFLHIPFPPVEIFRSLPFGAEILTGLLGADLLGFHAPSYMRHFAAAVTRVLGVPSGLDGIGWRDRTVGLGVFPMGIDASHFAELARDPATMADATALRQGGAMQLLVGIDRLDYTKGIPRRLLAYERQLRDHSELPGARAADPGRRAIADRGGGLSRPARAGGRSRRPDQRRLLDAVLDARPVPLPPALCPRARGALPRRGRDARHAAPGRHEPGGQGVRCHAARRPWRARPQRIHGRGHGARGGAPRQPV
jgi:trehalose 6-phosphate synthase/phosphatase